MMPRFAQVGNRIINLELITSVIYTPEIDDNKSLLVVRFTNPNTLEEFTQEQADQLWRVLKDASIKVV
ncbi:MAG TPA: hypothetical protein DEV81_07035 [Cyanobacteria bacterium UBA11049]|nr:hypothetical protein [Cyanobacteria bacterium UBA11049]